MKVGDRVKCVFGESKFEGRVFKVLKVHLKKAPQDMEIVDCQLVSGKLPAGHYSFKETDKDNDMVYMFRFRADELEVVGKDER